MSNTTIRFPNLGFEVHPGKYIEVFGFKIAFYGMLIGLGMLVGLLIAFREAKRTRQNVEDYLDFTIWTLIMAVVGARLYYVIFEWDYYSQHLSEIVLGIRNGGLAIYGGIIASVITLIIFTKIKKLSFWLMADTACLGLVVGQIIGRWGNFFNREAFGGYTNSIFAMQLPVDEANGVTSDLLRNAYVYNGHSYIQVHPTFLYEGLWNLGVFILLMVYRKHKKFNGEIFALYLVGYGIGRAWIEGLRTDQLLMPFFKFPVSQALSILLVIVSLIFIVVQRLRVAKNPELAFVAAQSSDDTNFVIAHEVEDDVDSDSEEDVADEEDEEDEVDSDAVDDTVVDVDNVDNQVEEDKK